MEYKGFEFKPGTVFNFESLQGQGAPSTTAATAVPEIATEAASEYAVSAGDSAYQQFCAWLPQTLELADLSPDLAPFLLEALHSHGDLYALLRELCPADEADDSVISNLVSEINSQYTLVQVAYSGPHQDGSPVGADEWDEDGPVEDPAGDAFGWSAEDEEFEGGAEGFNFVEKALELDDVLAGRCVAGGQAPCFSADATWQALCVCGGDVLYSCQLLEDALIKLNECKPCRHLLQGGCFRSDCRFTHDLSDVPCRFWLLSLSGCTLEQCPFGHSIDIPSGIVPGEYDEPLFDTSIEDSHFPQLGATSEKPPSGPAPYLKAAAGATASSVSYKDAAASAPKHGLVNPTWGSDKTASASPAAGFGGGSVVQDERFGIHDWVESGHTVGQTYEKLREDARQNAVARNRLFEEATRAYMSGQQDVAKVLSRRGKEANALMKECHLQASKEIFRRRNTRSSLSKGQIDLHGLHVAEMIECLNVMIPYFSTGSRRFTALRLATGSGHHTEGPQRGQAKLLPALVNYCADYGLKYGYILDPNGIKCGVIIKFT